jgi:hypothetical protein
MAYRYHLYDTTNGVFFGRLFIPETDACFNQRTLYFEIGLNYHIVLTFCNSGVMVATMYDLLEYSVNGRLKIYLKNGTRIHLKQLTHLFYEDIYQIAGSRHNMLILYVYLRNMMYRPVKCIVTSTELQALQEGSTSFFPIFNVWSNTIFLVGTPGPHVAVGFRPRCSPSDGQKKKVILVKINTSFHPRSSYVQPRQGYFNGFDGSYTHRMQYRQKTPDVKEYIMSIKIYKPMLF